MKRLEIIVPIPPGIEPPQIIQALQNHENIFTYDPTIEKWEKADIQHENEGQYSMFFWGRSCTDHPPKPVPYTATIRVPRMRFLGSWLSKTVTTTVLMQNAEYGGDLVRSELHLPFGGTVYSEWRVQRCEDGEGWEIEDVTRVDGGAEVREMVLQSHLAILKGALRGARTKPSIGNGDFGVRTGEIKVTWRDQPSGNWMGIGFG